MNKNLIGIFGISFLVFLVYLYSIVSSLSYIESLDMEKILGEIVKREIVQSFLAIFLFFLVFKSTKTEEVKDIFKKNRILVLLTFFFMVFGFFLGVFLGESIGEEIQPIIAPIIERAREIEAAPFYIDVLILFGNNTRVAILLGITFGAFMGVFYSPIVLMMNGIVVGVVPSLFNQSLKYLFVAILPHGIFEIPAFLLAGVCGIRLNLSLIKSFWYLFFPLEGKSPNQLFLEEVKKGFENLKLFYIIIPLLMIAAIVEATLTPFILNLLFG